MQERWAGLWQRVVREMKHSKAIIQKDKQESERTQSNIFCAWHQMFWKEGEVCFVPPSYKLFCEYLQGVSATDEWCWSVGLRLWGLTLLIKGGSQCARSAEGLTAREGMESTHWCSWEGRRQTVRENNPCSSLLKRSPGSLLAPLDLDKVWDFQWDSPSDTAVSSMGKKTLWDVVTFPNEPSCMRFYPREHKKAI